MVFSSLLFLFRFLPIVLLAYYILPKKCRNFVLFLSSLVFYAWGEPVYVVLILLSTCVDYAAGLAVHYFKEKGKMSGAKVMVACSAVINLALLGFFKYAGFFLQIVHQLTGLAMPELHLALPIGISFYTFQTMSYTIDVYRGDAKMQKNFITFGAYVALFPQLIAGPIVRFKDVAEQLDHRKETISQFSKGILRFMVGLGKKVLIANQVGALWSQIAAMPDSELTTAMAWLGVVAFTLQIYFDFSGYSLMALGLGRMLGFEFPKNFKHPYISRSVSEFWRRWHISLSTWFRDYVYIPLGGNRVGVWKHIRNILVVWMLTGIWHGASWNFVLWGLYYGILLLIEKFVLGKYLKKLPGVFQHIYCMFFVMLGWNLFVFDDMSAGISFARALFGTYGAGFCSRETLYLLYNNAVLMVLLILGSTQLPARAGNWICAKLRGKETILTIVKNVFYVGIFLLSVAWLVDASYNPFLYFRF
mgnify:CR=1 FL=1